MSATSYRLEHFYFGQTVADDQPQGEPRLLAHSPDVSTALATEAVALVTLPPAHRVQSASWGILRGGRAMPFVFVQAQTGRSGQVMAHYVLFPSDVIRALGGNLQAMRALVETELPVLTAVQRRLHRLTVTQPDPITDAKQTDDMLELMTITRNQIASMEKLLAALVQGQPLVIQHAPEDHDQRLRLIEGILALLPPSVRFAVTFVTRSFANSPRDVQIRFLPDDVVPPDDVLVYDWASARLSGEEVTVDDYSRFVMSQLRLDTQLVIDRTRALTPPTGWRMRQGDRLAEALAYGSHRLRIDDALRNNQPVSKADAAQVLSSDPTLSDSLRTLYAQHLLKLSLAMGAIQDADPVFDQMQSLPDLELGALETLSAQLDAQQAHSIYRLVQRWSLRETGLNYNRRWIKLAHEAAHLHADTQIKARDFNRLAALLRDIQLGTDALDVQTLATDVADVVLPLAEKDNALAEALFLLACTHLSTPVVEHLMELPNLMTRLPRALGQVWNYLSGSETLAPPAGLLSAAAADFGAQWSTLVLMRLAEIAQQRGRLDLIDQAALKQLADYAADLAAVSMHPRLLALAARIGPDDFDLLGVDGAYQLLRIKLACGDYPDLARTMIQQSHALYPGDLQFNYIGMLQRLFAETTVDSVHLPRALAEIHVHGIKSAPLLMAHIGALQGRAQAPESAKIAAHIETMLDEEPRLLSVIPPQSLLRVLAYYAQVGDVESARRVAPLLPTAAERQGADGLALSGQMYQVMDRSPATRRAGLEILRIYLRTSEDSAARQAVGYYGRKLGPKVRASLQATYFLNRLIPDADLLHFSQMVQAGTLLLYDTAAPFADRSVPNASDIIAGFNAMPGTLSREERRELMRALLGSAKAVVQLHQVSRAQRKADPKLLATGEADPSSVLDVLRVIGGYCAGDKVLVLQMQPPVSAFPLGTRSLAVLLRELESLRTLLTLLLKAFPKDRAVGIESEAIRGEVDSLLALLDAEGQSMARRALGSDLQRFVDLVTLIASSGDARVVMEDGNAAIKRLESGKQRPRSALEFYRMAYGFFRGYG